MRLQNNNKATSTEVDDLVGELSQNTCEAVKSLRKSDRHDLRVTVVVEPGSISQRTGTKYQGVTGDISSSGAQILLAKPLLVGDIYQVSFDRNMFDAAPVYALCLRARRVREDAFEAGIRFLEPFELPMTASVNSDELL